MISVVQTWIEIWICRRWKKYPKNFSPLPRKMITKEFLLQEDPIKCLMERLLRDLIKQMKNSNLSPPLKKKHWNPISQKRLLRVPFLKSMLLSWIMWITKSKKKNSNNILKRSSHSILESIKNNSKIMWSTESTVDFYLSNIFHFIFYIFTKKHK